MLIRLRLKFIIHNSFYLTSILSYDRLLVKMSESIDYGEIKQTPPKVYVIQEIAGTKEGRPKINILGAAQFGTFKFLLPELSQIIFSPGPLIFKLRKGLKDYRQKDYLLLTGDPAIIGVACSIVSDMTNGKYKLLKWDKQERKYYAIEINLHEKGNIDE